MHKMPQRPRAYNKVHGISTMMKHVEQERASLLKRFREGQHVHSQVILDREPTIKW
jgi:hypothetical protein